MIYERILMLAVVTAALGASPAKAEDHSWWLNVFFNVKGEWRSGSDIDGWSPREFRTEDECFARKSFAEKECREHPLDYPAQWFCSQGSPLDEPPEPLRGILCMNEK